ncbi:MAG: hypothetical protein K5696_07815, partial [Lachnospiraceae bacterium]|nr:hypothetical protein [Lachnospiraceae bacterium]
MRNRPDRRHFSMILAVLLISLLTGCGTEKNSGVASTEKRRIIYGSSKQLCLAIPVDNLEIMWKRFKACFVQIDIKDISDLLLLEDQENTQFALYTKNGANLSDTALGLLGEDDNILDGIREHISQASWEKISADFAEGRE